MAVIASRTFIAYPAHSSTCEPPVCYLYPVVSDMVTVLEGDCVQHLMRMGQKFHLTFLDPPFNQGKHYENADDDLPDELYWSWIKQVCHLVYERSHDGAALYFMHRDKNAGWLMQTLMETGWRFQNMIIWRKLTSAVPCSIRFGKSYQIIVFATRGKPRCFHRLRIDPPLPAGYSQPRLNGVYVTDVWDDIRELTSGYFAGDEALRDDRGERIHKQQSPVALLLRIILSSTCPGDAVLDPFAGTGTTGVVAQQLGRSCVLIENSPRNVQVIQRRLAVLREADNVQRYRRYYRFTSDLDRIWPVQKEVDDAYTGLFEVSG
ncbi:MAG: methyltransferase [Armatimonadota bacterium]|nr:MAG: methyltransferase [Armatimonadota bacterium]